jgi:hypothetical protein
MERKLRKMELNENATTHLAKKETVIPTTIAPDHPKTQANAVTCRTATRTKRPSVTKQNDFLWLKIS